MALSAIYHCSDRIEIEERATFGLALFRHAEAVATCPLLKSKRKNQIAFPKTILQQMIPDSLGATLQRVYQFEAQLPAIGNAPAAISESQRAIEPP
jgi:hypothetical protein